MLNLEVGHSPTIHWPFCGFWNWLVCLVIMMFCTTFLSAPSEDLGCETTGPTPLHCGHLGSGSCLSSLHCLVLPQDELYASLSDRTANSSDCSDERANSLVNNVLFDPSTCSTRDSGCIWDRVRGRRSRSASSSPCNVPHSPYKERIKGTCFSEGGYGS